MRRISALASGGALLVTLLAPTAPAGADQEREPGGPHVLWRATIGTPVDPSGLCEGAARGLLSEAMPLVGVDPHDEELVHATWSAHGERLQMAGTSYDGGRTWTAAPISDATACSSGPRERARSTNTLFDAGPDGAAYVGQSWFSSGEPVFQYGIAVHRLGSAGPGGEPVPGDVSSQNAAVLADPDDPMHVSVAWTWIPQVPNPITYTPLPNQVRFAESTDGGRTWTPHVVVHRAPPGELAVNPRLVRASDGGLVVLVDQGRLADFPAAQAGLAPAEFTFAALHSTDGQSWSEPVVLGAGEFYAAQRPDEGAAPAFVAVKPDLAAGPDGSVVAVWHDATRATVRMARSGDGGRSWSPAQDTVFLPGLPYQVAAAVDARGATGLFWYDFREDRAGDDAWTLRPWVAVQGRDGAWRETPVDAAFDLAAAEQCTSGDLPGSSSCQPDSHAGPLGVYQDLEGLQQGFAVAYTVSGSLVEDGLTDVRYARLAPGGRSAR